MFSTYARRRTMLAVTGMLLAVSMAGCGTFSDETEQKGKDAICASADASAKSLRAGGAGAKAVASAIYDVADDGKVKKAAKSVRDGNADEETIDVLVNWVHKAC